MEASGIALISCLSPPQMRIGNKSVNLINSNMSEIVSVIGIFYYHDFVDVTALEPSSGSSDGGTLITVKLASPKSLRYLE